MNRIIIILAACLLYPVLGRSADHKVLWKKATDFYLQKQYDSAAYYFETIAAGKPQNAEVYYNLGNTYYRLNKIALAVLNYERALHIDPSYTDASDNLSVTQARISHHIPVVEEIFFITWWKNITSHTRAAGWAITALIAFVLIIVAVWVRRYQKGGDRVPVQLPGILAFVCVVSLSLGAVAAANSKNSRGAVVMENDAQLMNDQLKGKPAALIPEGTTVKVVSERGMWLEVVLPDGRSGWLLQAQLTRI